MTDRIKIDTYTEMYLKFRQAYAWLENQTADMVKKVAEPLDTYWQEELTQAEREQWMDENEKLVDGK